MGTGGGMNNFGGGERSEFDEYEESERSGFDGLADDGECGLSSVNGLKVIGMKDEKGGELNVVGLAW